jgi:hypothetical protein
LTYVGVASVMFLLLMWSALRLSHRIAGPIYQASKM